MELLGSSLLHSMQRGEPLESTNPKLIYDSLYFLFFVFETVELDTWHHRLRLRTGPPEAGALFTRAVAARRAPSDSWALGAPSSYL
ncbi:hypothetical protein EVAR_76768_1 [Eumeta japonica]|uniref:Uncharacterized protein n=1 Tax=Eumeta variegata TaxID=151549 RepID=A0A4C1STP6_EUMVA|nr:hypothetical protein EVAR_76768_1 [Eumeta japonica]